MENMTFDLLYYESHFLDGKCERKLEGSTVYMSETDDCYLMRFFPDNNDPCCRELRFDHRTLKMIEEGRFLSKGNVKIGQWISYDMDGNVTEETDFDQDQFPLKWDQISSVLRGKGVGFDDMQIITRTVKPDGRGVWNFMIFRKPGVMEEVTIDGVDGAVLSWDEKQAMSESNFKRNNS